MPLEPGLIGFAALTSLALTMKKQRSALILPVRLRSGALRALGWALLGLAAAMAVWRFGPGMGVAAWIGQLSVAGAALVLLISWRPALVPGLALAALACVPAVDFI
ncbi:MAG: DUF3325 family protein [Phenylobacterium sp.]|uniref:DUF3325 family protein n=1 Tax=Phenylobacterium sp. TaxID=1871053 RepID=UPI003BB77042